MAGDHGQRVSIHPPSSMIEGDDVLLSNKILNSDADCHTSVGPEQDNEL